LAMPYYQAEYARHCMTAECRVFLSRLPVSLETQAGVHSFIHLRRDRAPIVIRGDLDELRAIDRHVQADRISGVVERVVLAYLRTDADTKYVYVLERPFVAIREVMPIGLSYRARNEYQCQMFAEIQCDIQVYVCPSGGIVTSALRRLLPNYILKSLGGTIVEFHGSRTQPDISTDAYDAGQHRHVNRSAENETPNQHDGEQNAGSDGYGRYLECESLLGKIRLNQ
jgi:hypothetical protein